MKTTQNLNKLFLFLLAGREIYQIKRETLSVVSVILLNWIFLTIIFLTPAVNFNEVTTQECMLWLNFSCTFCIFYFSVILPLISSFKEKKFFKTIFYCLLKHFASCAQPHHLRAASRHRQQLRRHSAA